MMWWVPGWGWAGIALMLICMVLMARMMGHSGRGGYGGHGSHGGPGGHGRAEQGRADVAERTLANRLASGEIDIDEYERLREALRRAGSSAGV